MKSKKAKFLDTFMLTTAIWLFIVVVLRYFLLKLFISGLVATVLSLGIVFFLRILSKNDAKERYLSEKMCEFFLLKDDEFILDYFYSSFLKRYKNVSKLAKYIKIENTFVFVCMNEPLTLRQAVNMAGICKKNGAKTMVILSCAINKNVELVKQNCNNLRVEIFDSVRVYRLLCSLKSVPSLQRVSYGARIKQLGIDALSPVRSRGYLFTAIPLLSGAIFGVYWLYFLICGAICLSLAIISRLNIVGV